MQGSNGPNRRGAWGVVAVVLLVGVHLVRGGAGEWPAGGPPQPLAAAASGVRAPAPAAVVAPLPASPPVRVRVPGLRIDAPVVRVALDAEGWIEAPPPDDRNLAGWFGGAVSPGERGTAVVVGHVDTPEGRAVFYDLGALAPGGRVEIRRTDGRTAVFTVYGVEVVPKEGFPAERVYGSTGGAELRLITCGGPYAQDGGYAGNVVVSARLTQVR